MTVIGAAMNDDIAVAAVDLAKTFGDVKAVAGVNLEIRKGELFGLVGPDGAGKTTMIRLLTAIMKPTAGSASVAGCSILANGEAIKEKIGYMSQRFGLYEDLTVRENIDFYADLYDVPKRERPERIARLLGFSNLTPFEKRLAGKLSGGMKQKLGLACALVHTPEILFLDEPTNGVDPVSRRDFWRILYDLLRRGVTIVVSTAYLDEAERCTRVGLMDKGRILIIADPGTIKKSLTLPVMELWCSDSREAALSLKGVAGVENVTAYGDRLHVVLAGSDVIDTVAAAINSKGVTILNQRKILPSLEDVFISMVEEA